MKLSARNQFRGTITHINEGAVNGIVALEFDGKTIKGTISLDAIRDLDLKVGQEAIAVIKATSVMVAPEKVVISARNQIAGAIQEIEVGAVNDIVKIAVAGGNTVSATISMDAVKELGLEVGQNAVAIVKATSVIMPGRGNPWACPWEESPFLLSFYRYTSPVLRRRILHFEADTYRLIPIPLNCVPLFFWDARTHIRPSYSKSAPDIRRFTLL